MSSELGREIEIGVETAFVAEQSNPAMNQYLFAYTITITNHTTIPVQLLNRHWIITDGLGRTEEVKGPGVVGKQPYLLPGQSFTYTSACPLRTPVGTMRGSYEMTTSAGNLFLAEIPQFTLAHKHSIN